MEGEAWKKIEEGIFDPFKKLKKEELIDELEIRGINTNNMKVKELKDELTYHLHGIARPLP